MHFWLTMHESMTPSDFFLIVRVQNLTKFSLISISRGEGKALSTDSLNADNYINKAAVPSNPWSTEVHTHT